jgi:transposase
MLAAPAAAAAAPAMLAAPAAAAPAMLAAPAAAAPAMLAAAAAPAMLAAAAPVVLAPAEPAMLTAPAIPAAPVASAASVAPAMPAAPTAPPRWTLRRLVRWAQEKFGQKFSKETLRAVLQRAKITWKKAKKILSRADPVKRAAYVVEVQALLHAAMLDDHLLVYIDEAHVHQDVEVGYGWADCGQRLWVCSTSPGLSAKVTFFGIYYYNEGQVRIWPYPRGNQEHTIDVLRRLRREHPRGRLTVVWDGASYHRAAAVLAEASMLDITIVPLPGYSPDFMPVEALWHWLREDVTYLYCHTTRDELIARVAAFEATINRDHYAVADRLWVKDKLDPEEEKLRISR